jgi:hypothetical protein
MVTPRRYFLTANPRIERVIAPFYFRILTHHKSPTVSSNGSARDTGLGRILYKFDFFIGGGSKIERIDFIIRRCAYQYHRAAYGPLFS